MPRQFDHLVLCVRDLEAARERYDALGFHIMPPADHPFGTRNRVIVLGDVYLELLTVGHPDRVPGAEPGQFSVGAFNQAFLREREGMSMLAFKGFDARADARYFAASGIQTYPTFDFSRDATQADGRRALVAFSLVFATDPAMQGLAFFTCQHHQPRELLSGAKREHPNGAQRVIEVMLTSPDPRAQRRFLQVLCEDQATVGSHGFTVGPPDNLVNVMRSGAAKSTRFEGFRVRVASLSTVERQLRTRGIAQRRDGEVLRVAPCDAFGIAIEFSEAS
jgi:catechol 2,3-dioxygenase-like lactoylglutathione lyase family enzyme